MTDTDDDIQAFALPPAAAHPADIAARLMRDPEHQHLADNEISIGYLMRLTPKEKGGKTELGSMHDAKYMAQGGFKELFAQLLAGMLGFSPQFVMVLDNQFWQQATDIQREVLIFHNLLRCKQALDRYGAPRFDSDGLPVYSLRAPDVEAFTETVVKYGAYSSEISEFAKAVHDFQGSGGW